MKEETLHPWIEPELEARIVALVLGEASDFEREELERLIAEQAELAMFKKRIEAVHGLLRETDTGESSVDVDDWKLSDEKRKAVLAVIGGEGAEKMKVKPAESVLLKPPGKSASKRGRFIKKLAKIAAVICVIGFIASLAMPRYKGIQKSSRKLDAKSTFAAAPAEAALEATIGEIGKSENHRNSGSGDQFAAVTASNLQNDSRSALSAIRSNLRRYSLTPESPEVIEDKLKNIVISSVDFQDTPLKEALGFLMEKSAEFDVTEPDPSKKGVNLVLQTGGGDGFNTADGGFDDADYNGEIADVGITLKLSDVPLVTALKYTVSLAQLKYKVEPNAVLVVPLSAPDTDLFTNTYVVPPTFMSASSEHDETGVSDPFAASATNGSGPARRRTAKDILTDAGVIFAPGASAVYDPKTSTLIIRNTQDQMELVEAYQETVRPKELSFPEIDASGNTGGGRLNVGGGFDGGLMASNGTAAEGKVTVMGATSGTIAINHPTPAAAPFAGSSGGGSAASDPFADIGGEPEMRSVDLFADSSVGKKAATTPREDQPFTQLGHGGYDAEGHGGRSMPRASNDFDNVELAAVEDKVPLLPVVGQLFRNKSAASAANKPQAPRNVGQVIASGGSGGEVISSLDVPDGEFLNEGKDISLLGQTVAVPMPRIAEKMASTSAEGAVTIVGSVLESQSVAIAGNSTAAPRPLQKIPSRRSKAVKMKAKQDEQVKKAPEKKLFITSKFIEIQQNNEGELGFEWLKRATKTPGDKEKLAGLETDENLFASATNEMSHSSARSDYASATRNHTSAEFLQQVATGWELPVPTRIREGIDISGNQKTQDRVTRRELVEATTLQVADEKISIKKEVTKEATYKNTATRPGISSSELHIGHGQVTPISVGNRSGQVVVTTEEIDHLVRKLTDASGTEYLIDALPPNAQRPGMIAVTAGGKIRMKSKVTDATKEETSKLKTNTDAGGLTWKTPRPGGEIDRNFARYQPAQHEWQRYPGHPASASLDPVLNSAPQVSAHSGKRSVVEVLREFIYPKEYDPPEIPRKENKATMKELYRLTPYVVGGGKSHGQPSPIKFIGGAYHSGDSKKNTAKASPEAMRMYPSIDKFFITTASRAPEVSLDNKPLKKLFSAAGLNEKNAQDQAFSTFSLHVSDVSFKLAQAALAKGEWPEAAKVRIEEFVNAFDYGDPMPNQDEKVACRLEQTIHPFLQQRNLLRVSMRTAAAGRSGDTPLRLTLLLDNSGSMERSDRQQTVQRAFALLVQQLKPMDQVTLISFARQPRLLADKVSGAKAKQLVQLVTNLPSEGGTNLEAALQLAFEKAKEQQIDNAQNRIIMLTDGAANLGDANPDYLSRMIETMRDAGIAFDAAGIGADGLNDEILEALTRKGDGRYYLLDQPEDADEGFARQIAGALRPAAKNVKVQIEFNPKRVGHYKLLGFEKHRLKKEDFRNDKVDAAEMAAAEAGVAVYQFEARPDGEGDVGSVSVRFRDMSTGQMVENRWPIPYEADAPRIDMAAPSLRIATAAALLAAKLKGEPLGESVDLKTLSNLIAGLPERQRNIKRVQQLQQMINAARAINP